jgi:hypothetical protein
VIVIESPKRPCNLGIPEMPRPIEECNATRQPLPNAKVCSLPRDLFTWTDEAAGDPCDSALVGPFGRQHVQIDVTRKIETHFYRRVDDDMDLDNRHDVNSLVG